MFGQNVEKLDLPVLSSQIEGIAFILVYRVELTSRFEKQFDNGYWICKGEMNV